MSSKCARVVAVAALGASLWAAAPAAAGEKRPLTDFVGKGEWEVFQWNKAKGQIEVCAEPPPAAVGKDAPKQSLRVKIAFPGGEGFRFFNLVPSRPFEPVPHPVLKVTLWLKGAGTPHYVQINFRDGEGKQRKAGMGRLSGTEWGEQAFKVPKDWPQPLTLESVSFHDWSIPQPADVTFYLSRLEVEVDPAKRVDTASGEALAVPDIGAAEPWQPFRWNRAKGTAAVADEFPPDVKVGPGQSGKSRRLEIDFPAGSSFAFYQLLLAEPLEIANRALEASCWFKGSGTPHSVEFYFRDAAGKTVKLIPGKLDFDGWKQLRARIPANWAQPLKLTGLGIQNWAVAEAAKITVHAAAFEVRVAAGAPLPKPPSGVCLLSDLNVAAEWPPDRWCTAEGSAQVVEDFPEVVRTEAGQPRKSLQLKLKFPAEPMKWYAVRPPAPRELPAGVRRMSLWAKGTGTGHTVELHLLDAEGKRVKLVPGKLDFEGWRALRADVPADWPQPLKFNGVAIHSFAVRKEAQIAPCLTRVEFTVGEPAAGGGGSKGD